MLLNTNQDQSKVVENFVLNIITTSDQEFMGHPNSKMVREPWKEDPVGVTTVGALLADGHPNFNI